MRQLVFEDEFWLNGMFMWKRTSCESCKYYIKHMAFGV